MCSTIAIILLSFAAGILSYRIDKLETEIAEREKIQKEVKCTE